MLICGYEADGLVEVVKKRKFKYFGHLVRGAGVARKAITGRQGKATEKLLDWKKAVYSWLHKRPPCLRS